MGLFKSIGETQPSGLSGNYFKDGTHYVKVRRIIQGVTRKRIGYVAGDFTVLDHPDATKKPDGTPVHKPGTVVNWFSGDDKDGFLGNTKALFCAVLSEMAGGNPVDPDTVDEATAEAITEGAGTFAEGVLLKVTAVSVDTRSGGVFTKCIWEPFVPSGS